MDSMDMDLLGMGRAWKTGGMLNVRNKLPRWGLTIS